MIISTSERLSLREATLTDVDFYLALLNEPAWHQFIYQHDMNTREKIVDYLGQKVIPAYRDLGFGFWVVEQKDNNRPIGICGFIKRESLPHPDLGFAFLESHWGKGYAFEAAEAALDYARSNLNLEKVLAITLPENKRSSRLLERLEFEFESTYSHPGSDEVLLLYSINISAP